MGTTRRVLRPILAVPVAIAATALGLLVLVPLVLLLPAARRSVLGAGLARVEKILPGNLTFEEARWHGPLAFRFTGAVWTDEGDTLASFDTLQIAVRPLKLLRHDLSLSRLLARDVRADLPAILERFPKKPQADTTVVQQARQGFFRGGSIPGLLSICLLYTSDAADEFRTV
ncbi:MAG: hypothetical protein QUU85_08315 [Candidatus Eisenbacteria bacterium]|nr:hypothetical protein [Candidatus Eisenbacteria bacterium]